VHLLTKLQKMSVTREPLSSSTCFW